MAMISCQLGVGEVKLIFDKLLFLLAVTRVIIANKHSIIILIVSARECPHATSSHLISLSSRYTRNLVDAGNGRFNLMILCWNEGQSSTIHDHSDSHCFMKMLSGGLTEIKYSWPQDTIISNLEPKCDIGNSSCYQIENEEFEKELQEISRTTMHMNDVCYINGKFWHFYLSH